MHPRQFVLKYLIFRFNMTLEMVHVWSGSYIFISWQLNTCSNASLIVIDNLLHGPRFIYYLIPPKKLLKYFSNSLPFSKSECKASIVIKPNCICYRQLIALGLMILTIFIQGLVQPTNQFPMMCSTRTLCTTRLSWTPMWLARPLSMFIFRLTTFHFHLTK